MTGLKKAFQLLFIAAVTVIPTFGIFPAHFPPANLPGAADGTADSLYKELPAVYNYTEGIKRQHILRDDSLALEYFEKAIAADSTHAPSYFEAANILALTDLPKAIEYSTLANALDSANVWYKGQHARLLLFAREYDLALESYRRLLKISPYDPEIYRMLAALYEYRNQPFNSIAILDSAETKVGRIEELSAYKRELLINLKYYDRAINESLELIAEYPYDYRNYLILADVYQKTGKDSLALEYFLKAADMNPGGVDALASLNDFYRTRGNMGGFFSTSRQLLANDDIPVETKIDFFEDLTKDRDFYRNYFFQIKELASVLLLKYPSDYRVGEIYASSLIAYGNIDEALELYKNYLEKATEPTLDMFSNIIEIEAYLQRPDSVEKYTARGLRLYPGNIELHLRKGSILSYMNNDKAAIAAYKQALKYADSDSVRSVIYGVMGDTYHVMEQEKKSYSSYDKALSYWLENIVVLNNYSYFLSLEEKNLDKALAMASKVMELEPGNPTYLDTYAWVLYKLKRFDEARIAIRQAVALDRTNSKELFIHYGDILYELEDYFMASRYWKKALEAGYDQDVIEARMKKIEQ